MRLITVCLLLTAACANSSPKSGQDAPVNSSDAAKTIDAANQQIDARIPVPDAAQAAILGAACTGQGQGSCPTGYECLNLQGASGSWCSKQCTMGAGDTCDMGYTGPGVGACLLNVTPAAGGAPQPFCTIICQDEPGAPTLCVPDTRCNSACPTPLTCTGALTTSMGAVVGHTCN